MLEFGFDGKEWTSSFRNKEQSSVSHGIGTQSSSVVERNHAAAANNNLEPCSFLGVMFCQACPPSFFNQPPYFQPGSVTRPHQDSMPAITLDDSQAPYPLIHGSSNLDRGTTGNVSSFTQSGLGSNTRWASTVGKGVTYPRHYDDPVAEISLYLFPAIPGTRLISPSVD